MLSSNENIERIEEFLNEKWIDYLTYKNQTDLDEYKGATKLLKALNLEYRRGLDGKHKIK